MISVVVPIYNEAQLINELVERLVNALLQTEQAYEILFVDDGSTDNSIELLCAHQKSNSKLKIIALSRNFGHQAAYTAGIDYVQGDYLVLMDGDLQDPPELIPQMFQLIKKEDVDIVNGYRKANSSIHSRNFFTKVFHGLFNRITELEEVDHIGNFSMMNKASVEALKQMKEKSRYLPGLRHFIGFKSTQISYHRDEREAGKSKMSTRKLFHLAFDAIFAFSKVPLKFCLIMGVIGIIISFLAGIYILLSKYLGLSPLGWSSTLTSIYFLGSIQLVFLGILGEYVFRIYRESQNRPIYFIRKVYTQNDTTSL